METTYNELLKEKASLLDTLDTSFSRIILDQIKNFIPSSPWN